jgi:GNAT superfamily N-acetyltransferase
VELTDFYGLPVAFMDVDEALAGRWQSHPPPADVIRVDPAPQEAWPRLRGAGFFPKPKMVTWLAEIGERGYPALLTWKERQNIRAAQRRAAGEGLTLSAQPLDSSLLAAFLPLYRQQVAGMRHGWAVADEQREDLLAEAGSYFAVCAYACGALVGACLARCATGRVTVRFSAVAPQWRRAGLTRVLYAEAIEEAGSRGYRSVSLGTDPNLYGHIAKPGLLGFKSRLGFTAHPAHHVLPGAGNDQADLVLGLGGLSDPAMLLAYAAPGPGQALALEAFSTHAGVDLRPFTGPFAAGSAVHIIAASGRRDGEQAGGACEQRSGRARSQPAPGRR